jgi:tetratricopeptide (TPR) repeat protein
MAQNNRPSGSAMEPLASAVSAPRWSVVLACALLIAAGAAAYSNCFTGTFLYDDVTVIQAREDRLWPPVKIWATSTAVPDYTFALNYRLDGFHPLGWHVVNLAIHLLAGLTLFGLVRRTLPLVSFPISWIPERRLSGAMCTLLASAVALLWMVHPLQTESVTYIVQRQTALMGLFYLLTIYGLLRGATSPKRGMAWYAVAVAACALGMRSKQSMATAPLMALLFDRTFLAGTFRLALRKRWILYLLLAATWGLLYSSSERIQTVGLGIAERQMGMLDYARTQFGVIRHYIRLCFWPTGLTLDYNWPIARTLDDVAAPAAMIVPLLAIVLWALWKRPAWGFLGAWFFVILAPTSSFITILFPAYEHRLYLSLAAVVVAAVFAAYWLTAKAMRRFVSDPQRRELAEGALVAVASVAAAIALGLATYERNKDYQSPAALWQANVLTRPQNPRAHAALGEALAAEKKYDEAVASYHAAIYLDPYFAQAWSNLGAAELARGNADAAVTDLRRSVQLDPTVGATRFNLALALERQDSLPAAMEEYRQAIRLNPALAAAHYNLGNLLAREKNREAAVAEYELAVRYSPRCAQAYHNMGVVQAAMGRFDEAEKNLRLAAQYDPDRPESLAMLAAVLARQNRFDEASNLAQQAADLADKNGNRALAGELRLRGDLYRTHRLSGSPPASQP